MKLTTPPGDLEEGLSHISTHLLRHGVPDRLHMQRGYALLSDLPTTSEEFKARWHEIFDEPFALAEQNWRLMSALNRISRSDGWTASLNLDSTYTPEPDFTCFDT